MAFIDSEETQNQSNIDESTSFIDEFNIRTILTNQQALIIEMQQKMDFIFPKMENELIAINEKNKSLVEQSIAHELEIRKIKQKIYQTHKYAESIQSMIASKLIYIEFELERLDSDYDVLKNQIDRITQMRGLRTSSYKAYTQRLKL